MTLASDIILRDVGRGTIVVQGEDYDKFKCLFKKGVSSYTNIEFEDNLSTNIKDRSVSSAFLGFDEGSYFEMRLKYPYIDIEAEFGKYEHLKYKKSELEDYLKKHKNSEFLQKCLDKLCVIFNTNSKDVLTL